MTVTSLYNGTVSYDTSSNTYSVSTNITTANLNSLFASAADSSTVALAAGTFHLTSTIDVYRSDITVEGMGSGQTTLEADFSAPATIFQVSGNNGLQTNMTANANVGDTSVSVANGALFHVGDIVQVYAPNDAAFLATPIPGSVATSPYLTDSARAAIINSGSLYGDVANQSYMTSGNYPLQVTLTEVTAVNGNTLTLKDGLAFAMSSADAHVEKINTINDVTLGGFSITNNLGTPIMGDISNELPAWQNTDALRLSQTNGTIVNDVSIINAPSEGLTARSTYGAQVSNVTINGAFDKGEGGNGYGLNLAGAQQSVFTNMTILNTRHGVLFSSWATEIGNTINVLQTNRDINFHGSPDSGNTVIVQQDILGYGTSTTNGFPIVSTVDNILPYTDVDANTTQFTYAMGYVGNDVIHGTNNGAYESGGWGNDTLIGGNGNDVLIGGKGNDTLTGGKGADTFVMDNRVDAWQAADTITDFSEAQGDKMVFINGANLNLTAANVHFVAQGADTLIWVDGINGSFLLKGVTTSQVNMNDIILNHQTWSDDPTTWINKAPVVATQGSGDGGAPGAAGVDVPPPAPVPSVPVITTDPAHNFVTVAAVEHLTGGTGNDTVTGGNSSIQGDTYNLGAGLDTLVITNCAVYMTAVKMPTMTGVDVIDVSHASTVTRLGFTDAQVTQSDNDLLTVVAGTPGISWLSAAITSSANELLIDSKGDVYLADSVNNVITLSNDSTGAIHGGTGNDTINGGTGNDTMSGGAGANTFAFSGTAIGSDTVTDFSETLHDKLSFSIAGTTLTTANVHFATQGSDTLVTVDGMTGSVLLQGVGSTQVALGDIVLNGHIPATTVSPTVAANAAIATAVASVAPVADPALHFTATAAVEHVTGTGYADTVTGANSSVQGDTYNMGAGTDTLVINNCAVYMTATKMPIMTGVDVIDVSQAASVSKLGFNDALVAQSDNDLLTVKAGTAGISWLSADIHNAANTLVINSQGDVHLADGVNNTITLSDSNTGAIYGGTGNDTIIGGAGAVDLYGGAGADVFKLLANVGNTVATIHDFNPAQDVLDLSGMLTSYNATQNSIDDFVHATTVNGQAAIQVDMDGTGTAHAMQTVAVFSNQDTVDIHALIASHHLVV